MARHKHKRRTRRRQRVQRSADAPLRARTRRHRVHRGGHVPDSLKVVVQSGAAAGPEGAADTPLFTKEETRQQPAVSWVRNRPADLYTLVCVDPDAPGPNAPWLHWLVANCAGEGVASGEVVVPWAPPTPPSGTHRYIFKLYRQAGAGPVDMSDVVRERPAFPLEGLVAEKGLVQVDSKEYRVAA
jgi:phosphatidylethanolamine-binding protein (PEBP) family uncharacterized protein